jgi:HK97 family phage portal protein
MKNIKKIVSPHDNFATRSKASRGFVENMTDGEAFAQPRFYRLTDLDAYNFFRFNEWFNACIIRIVKDCTKVKMFAVPKDDDKEISGRLKARIDKVNALFANPNDNKESFKQIRKKFLQDGLVFGRGSIEKVNNKLNGEIQELYAQDASQVKMKVDKHGNMPEKNAYRLLGPNGEKVLFDKDEMILNVFYPDSKSIYGLKPADTLANALASDMLRETFNTNFFLNGAEASGILSLEGMSQKELKRFRQYYGTQHKGAGNAHKMLAVNTKMNYQTMAQTNRDMQFGEYGIELRNKIFAVLNMQPVIMGVVDASTGKLNSEQQVEAYKNGAIIPLLDDETYAYTKEVVEVGFGYDDVKVVYGSIDILDSKTQAEINQIDLANGVVVINDIRRRRNEPPVPWGDTPINTMPGGGQIDPDTGRLIPPSEQGNNSTPNSTPNDSSDDDGGDKSLMDMYFNKIKKVGIKTYHNRKSLKNLKSHGPKLIDEIFEDTKEASIAYHYYNNVYKLISKNKCGSREEVVKKIDKAIKFVKKSKLYNDIYNKG